MAKTSKRDMFDFRNYGNNKVAVISTRVKKVIFEDGSVYIPEDGNRMVYLNDPIDNLNFRLRKGYIDEEKYNTLKRYLEEKSVKYAATVPVIVGE